MRNSKIYMRRTVIDKKDKFKRTNNYMYAVEAATIKGVYNGLGGTMKIPLPPYCNVITEVVRSVFRARDRFKGDVQLDTNKLKEELQQITRESIGIRNEIVENKRTIAIYGRPSRDVVRIRVENNITDNILVGVALVIIRELSIDYRFSESELKLIGNTFSGYMRSIERNKVM